MSWAMKEKDYSQRHACALVGMAPKTYRHVPARPDDAMLRSRLREMANARRRFGYRRLHLLLRREGVAVNHKKLFRLYREAADVRAVTEAGSCSRPCPEPGLRRRPSGRC